MRDNSNDFLRKAKKNKNDEFYTQMIDIERELKYYTNQFSGKIVYTVIVMIQPKVIFINFLLKIFIFLV